MVTPVDDCGEIDIAGSVRLAKWLVSKRVNGIFVGGTTGRFSHFASEQNATLCTAIAEAVGDQVTIYGGICDSGVPRMLRNAALMKSAGADLAVATGPYYLSRLQEEREGELELLADRSPLPVMFYDIPEFVGYRLSACWLERMADHENVVGYKDSSDDWRHHLDVLARTRCKKFAVLMGKELLLADALQSGAQGLVVSLLQADPEPFVVMTEEATKGNWEAVRQQQGQVGKIVDDFLTWYKPRPVFSTLLRYLEFKLRANGLDIRLE
jgi:4-hydroxy-tetrahydrodipicolinate synthase